MEIKKDMSFFNEWVKIKEKLIVISVFIGENSKADFKKFTLVNF